MNKKSNIIFYLLIFIAIIFFFFFGLFVSYINNKDGDYSSDNSDRIKEIIIDNPTYEF